MITDISQLDPKGTYTYADYLKWRFDEQVELIKGKIYLMSPAPKRMHQSVRGQLGSILCSYFEEKQVEVYNAPFDVRLPVPNSKKPSQIYTVVQPDICVICDLTKLDDDGSMGAPDLVVEITSPRTAKKDFNEKFLLYEEAGVREYWIVQPKEKAINTYVLENGEYQLVDVFESGEIPCQIFPELIVSHERVFRSIV